MDAIPLYGECSSASSSLSAMTSSEGVSVHVILGDMPYAEYPVKASCTNPQGQSFSVTFYLHSHPFGNCDGESPPGKRLVLTSVYPSDKYGNNINAGKTETSIPLIAKMYLLREGAIEVDGTIIDSREYSVDINLNTPAVLYDDQQAMPEDVLGFFLVFLTHRSESVEGMTLGIHKADIG